MDTFQLANLECKLSLNKISHICESLMDTFFIEYEETRLSSVVEESVKELMYKESVSEIGKKIVAAIQKIIDTIRDFCGKMKDAIVEKFSSKESKEKLDKINEALKEQPDKGNEKVEIVDDKKEVELLNKYIQEMAKLERKLMNIKIQATDGYKFGDKEDASLIISANQILHEMDNLNDKYDKELLNKNDDIIKMALKDAIRFSEKQLNNVKVDYDAVQKESERILAEFKKDAEGCDNPVKYNILQKMANAVGTRARKHIQKKTAVKKKNMALIYGTALAVLGITAVSQYATNPAVTNGVDSLAAQAGIDMNKVKQDAKTKLQQLAARGANP